VLGLAPACGSFSGHDPVEQSHRIMALCAFLKPRFRVIFFFCAASAPVNGWPTLALELATSGAWNVYNSLVCSVLRSKSRVIAGKIKKLNRY
jgi:hypothetical protein